MCSKFGLVFSGINTEDVKNEELKKTFEPRRYVENTKYIELHGLNPMPNIIRIIRIKRMFCKCSKKGEMKSEYRILVGKI